VRTQSVIFKVLQKNLEYDEDRMTVGTHTLRKTGFLFAVFGVLTEYNVTGRRSRTSLPEIQPMEDSAICCAARHKATTKPHAYYQDAKTRFIEYQMDPQLAEENRVAPWKANFVQNETIRKTLSLDGKYDDSIEKLADDYVKKELKVDVEKVKNVTIAQLLLLSIKTNLTRKSDADEFNELTVALTDAEKEQLERHIERRIENYRLHFAGAIEDKRGGGELTFVAFSSSVCLSHIVFDLNLQVVIKDSKPVATARQMPQRKSQRGPKRRQKRGIMVPSTTMPSNV